MWLWGHVLSNVPLTSTTRNLMRLHLATDNLDENFHWIVEASMSHRSGKNRMQILQYPVLVILVSSWRKYRFVLNVRTKNSWVISIAFLNKCKNNKLHIQMTPQLRLVRSITKNGITLEFLLFFDDWRKLLGKIIGMYDRITCSISHWSFKRLERAAWRARALIFVQYKTNRLQTKAFIEN